MADTENNNASDKAKSNKAGWIIGTITLLIASVMIAPSNENGSLISALFFYMAAFMIFPPIVRYIEGRKKPILKGKVKTAAIAIMIVAGIITSQNSVTSAPQFNGSVLNAKQTSLIYHTLLEDYRIAQEGGDAVIGKDEWQNILVIQGQSKAKEILKDFKINEVAAVQKYNSRWIVTGKIYRIEDSFNEAHISLGSAGLASLNAKMKNKNLAATYLIGNNVKFVCENIGEAISIVFGDNCTDYNYWLERQIGELSQNPNNFLIKVMDQQTQNIISRVFEAILYLKDDSPCYGGLKSNGCQEEMGAIAQSVKAQ